MAVTEPYEIDGVTVGAAELSVISGTTTLQSGTTPGLYQWRINPPASGSDADLFIARVYEKVEATGGSKRLLHSVHFPGSITRPITWPQLMLMYGYDFTLQKISGTDRAFDSTVELAAGGSGVVQHAELDGVTISGSEISVISGTTSLATDATAGAYQLWLDPVADPMLLADIFEINAYEIIEATGGSKVKVFDPMRLQGAQNRLWVSPIITFKNGMDWTLTKIAGADQAFDASLRRVS